MGYTTRFKGHLSLSSVLTPEQVHLINAFSRARHGSNTHPSLISDSFWCNWEVSGDGQSLRWNGMEKFYSYVEWLHFLNDVFFCQWQVVMQGTIKYLGESPRDRGHITASPWNNGTISGTDIVVIRSHHSARELSNLRLDSAQFDHVTSEPIGASEPAYNLRQRATARPRDHEVLSANNTKSFKLQNFQVPSMTPNKKLEGHSEIQIGTSTARARDGLEIKRSKIQAVSEGIRSGNSIQLGKLRMEEEEASYTTESIFSFLPDNALLLIGCSMEMEDMLRLKMVCKCAYALFDFTSHAFLALWRQRHPQPSSVLMLPHMFDFVTELPSASSISCYNVPKKEFQDIPISRLVPAPGYVPIAASGPLICCQYSLDNWTNYAMMVGNPITNKWVQLPHCPTSYVQTWDLATYPDDLSIGKLFFVVYESTCQCWFDSKLGAWKVRNDGLYGFGITSNLLHLDNTIYAMCFLQGQDEARVLERQLRVSVLDKSNDWTWKEVSSRPTEEGISYDACVTSNNNMIMVFYDDAQGGMIFDSAVSTWQQVGKPFQSYSDYGQARGLTLELRLEASPCMKMDVEDNQCASRYWKVGKMNLRRVRYEY